MSIIELAEGASPEAVALAEDILRDDIASQAWRAQTGPCLTRQATARLLAKSEQAVAKDRRLVVVRNADGRPLYPTFQFDGARPLAGLDRVAETLTATGDDDLTILAWLTTSKPALEGRSPVDALRAGDIEPVVLLAEAWAE